MTMLPITAIIGAGSSGITAAKALRFAASLGIVPELDAEYMAAAMVGAALEVGVKMIERDPPDVDAATRFATAVFIGGIERLSRS